MYDAFSQDYDRFVDWPARLSGELPYLQEQLKAVPTAPGHRLRILDAACGTGMHAIALAQLGCQAAGADLSAGMVRRARENAAAAGVEARFETAGFGELEGTFGRERFDALLCLGNSLPHVLDEAGLAAALADFAACLRPGGLVLIQNRNFDAVVSSRERWMEPQAYREEDPGGGMREWLFLRFYDFDPDGLVTFNVVTLRRAGEGGWEQQVNATRLRPLLQAELEAALAGAGFGSLRWFGNMAGAAYDREASGNLVVTARLEGKRG